MASETKTPYDSLTIIREKEIVPSHVTSLDELCTSLSVKTEKAFQVLSPELVVYVLCKRTAIAKTLGVYNEKELDNAGDQCIEHGYDFGNYSSRAIPKKRTIDTSIKEPKPSSKKENRYRTVKTCMSASKDADFVLRSTWNMVIEK